MRSRRPIFTVAVSALALLVAGSALAAPTAEGRAPQQWSLAKEQLSGTRLALEMKAPFDSATLTLKGPNGFNERLDFNAGEAVAVELGGDLAAGLYRYTLRVSPRPEKGNAVKTGMFFVENGAVVSRQAKRGELEALRAQLNEERQANRAKRNKTEARTSPEQGGGASRPPGPEGAIPVYDGLFIYGFAPEIDIYEYGYPIQGFYWNNGDLFQYTFSDFLQISNGFHFDFAAANFLVGTFYPYQSFLAVTPYGVGVQTIFPYADLEVYDYNDYAAMRLNNGTASWAFSNTPSGVFTVNLIGSGGQEFAVRPRLDAAGNTMQVQGSVQGTKFVASSSRDLKTDFTALDGQEVLAKLAEIPVMSWRYKTDDETDRHFGPVAEDFQAAFQLGDGKTIANIDADGVALAAIQGLHKLFLEELASKDQQIAELERRLAALEERPHVHPQGAN